jgi:hypothetical protein
MSRENKGHPARRLRGPNIKTILTAAAEMGRHLTGVVTKPDGDIVLEFSQLDDDNRPGPDATPA